MTGIEHPHGHTDIIGKSAPQGSTSTTTQPPSTFPFLLLWGGGLVPLILLAVLLAVLLPIDVHRLPPGSEVLAWTAGIGVSLGLILTFGLPLLFRHSNRRIVTGLRISGTLLGFLAYISACVFLQWSGACDANGVCHWTVPM